MTDAQYYLDQAQREIDGYERGAAGMERQMNKMGEEISRYRRLCRELVKGGFLADAAYADIWHHLKEAAPAEVPKCCNGTGYADYAAVPCRDPKCPVKFK